MSNATLPAATAAKLAKLPAFSATVLHTILNALYAEPGFSDIVAADIATALGTDKRSTAGAIARLIDAGLIFLDVVSSNGRTQSFIGSQLHDDAGTKELVIAYLEAMEGFCTPIVSKPAPTPEPSPAPSAKPAKAAKSAPTADRRDAKNNRRRMRQYLRTLAYLSFLAEATERDDDTNAELVALGERAEALAGALFGPAPKA